MGTREGQDERLWATFCHLAALLGYIGVPFGNVIGPLVVWLIKRDQLPLVEDQGKESLNFQISMTIYTAAAIILSFVLIGIPILLALLIGNLVLVIVAAIRANNGEAYRYPLTIRFVR